VARSPAKGRWQWKRLAHRAARTAIFPSATGSSKRTSRIVSTSIALSKTDDNMNSMIFTRSDALAGRYSRLLDHAAIAFSARVIMILFGRLFHPGFDGSALRSWQNDRWPESIIR
jgi:hypothetical protein